MKKYWNIFINGLLKENPLLVIMIGLCSSLAVTTPFITRSALTPIVPMYAMSFKVLKRTSNRAESCIWSR